MLDGASITSKAQNDPAAYYDIGPGDPALNALVSTDPSIILLPDDGSFGGQTESLSGTVTAPSTPGTYRICIHAIDSTGNGGNSSCTTLTVVPDATPPTVGLSRIPAADPSNAASFSITATWSEAVVGFDASDVGAVNGVVSGFTGSGASYIWTVTPTATGTVSTSVAATAATDLAGNPSGGAVGLSWISDLVAPTVSGVVVSPTTASPGAAVVVSAATSDSIAVASAQVSVAGGAWASMTASDGVFGGTSEAVAGSVAAPASAGSYQVCVRATDSAGNTSGGTACATLLVRIPTALVYTGPTKAAPGASIALSATLTTTSGTAISGRTVSFTLNGTVSSATTNTSGVASVTRTAPTTTGNYSIIVTFAGGTTYLGSTASGSLSVHVPTTLTYTGATTAAPGSSITLTATLKGSGSALSGRTVSFTLNGTTKSATTNGSGVAGVTFTAPSAGDYTISVAFAGGTTYAASSTSATLAVRIVTKLTYTGPTTASRSSRITLSATLRTSGGTAIAGRTVSFKLGSTTSTVTTNSSGVASVTRTAPSSAATYTITITFAGDTTYAASSASPTLKVS